MKFCKTKRLFGKKTTLLFMLVMTSSFFVAEITVGYMTNSTALVADSFHMLSDVLSLIIGFLAVFYSKKNSGRNTYGWARAEVLGALANAVFLFALCFSIFVSAVQRLISIEEITEPLLIVYVGSAGFMINVVGLILFYGHSFNEENDESIAESKDEIEEFQVVGSQLNMKAVFLHVLGDALGSVVVLVSALTIHYAEGHWRFYVDPAVSLTIAAIIICTTWPLLKESGLILLQSPPSHIKKRDLLDEMTKICGVQAIHEFHVWQLAGNVMIASAHITMHKGDSFNETAMKLNKLFHSKGVHSLTLQPEFYECSDGQSICGSHSCSYLVGNDQNLNPNSEKQPPQPNPQHRNDSSASLCLFPCVSSNCKKYQCCSDKTTDKKTKPKDAETEGDGAVNPSFTIEILDAKALENNKD